MTDPDLVAEVRDLRDRADVARVLATFCARVDEYDIDAVAQVFTEDCTVDYGPGRGGPQSGRARVAARIARGQSQFRRTHHQLGQSLVDIHGDRAHAVTYVTAWHEENDDSISEVRLRYVDELTRTPSGWLISRRDVLAAGIVGFAGVPWNWVRRGAPSSSD